MKRSHPAFDGYTIPREIALGPVRLEVLGPGIVDEDLAAVEESAGRLAGLFGDGWPAGLTREENWIDLAWHLREFDQGRSFAWVIRDAADGAYLGCFYVYPDFGAEPGATSILWVRSGAAPEHREPALAARLGAWLAGPDWPAMPYRIHLPRGRVETVGGV